MTAARIISAQLILSNVYSVYSLDVHVLSNIKYNIDMKLTNWGLPVLTALLIHLSSASWFVERLPALVTLA